MISHDQIKDEVIRSLHEVGTTFRANELAFLALTCKIEFPVRDRWSSLLFERLDSSIVVSREWKKTDLAVLRAGTPLFLVELKAMYSWDAALWPVGIKGYAAKLDADLQKAQRLATPATSTMALLLSTHPCDTIPQGFQGVIKYDSGINRAIRALGDAERVRAASQAAVTAALSSKRVVAHGAWDAGAAFGLPVVVDYWAVEAATHESTSS